MVAVIWGTLTPSTSLVVHSAPGPTPTSISETLEWKKLYNRRTAVERIFSRFKEQRKLNNVTVRRKKKVTIHCFLSIMVVQAQFLSRITHEEL